MSSVFGTGWIANMMREQLTNEHFKVPMNLSWTIHREPFIVNHLSRTISNIYSKSKICDSCYQNSDYTKDSAAELHSFDDKQSTIITSVSEGAIYYCWLVLVYWKYNILQHWWLINAITCVLIFTHSIEWCLWTRCCTFIVIYFNSLLEVEGGWTAKSRNSAADSLFIALVEVIHNYIKRGKSKKFNFSKVACIDCRTFSKIAHLEYLDDPKF